MKSLNSFAYINVQKVLLHSYIFEIAVVDELNLEYDVEEKLILRQSGYGVSSLLSAVQMVFDRYTIG
jgi:hypothetical protein